MVSTVDGAIVSSIVLSQKHIIEALAAIEVYITVLTHISSDQPDHLV